MNRQMRAALALGVMVAVSGCAVKGGWMGAEAEKAYDKDLDAKRLAEVQNSDDYYEIHKDGRIYVLSDAKAYQGWVQTNEIPLVVTRIGSGPNGETVKMALTKTEAKAMESIVGYKGAAQKMFEGTLAGADKGFFAFIAKNGTYYVFDNWNTLQAYRSRGETSGFSDNSGPGGAKVVYVNANSRPAELAARFAKVIGS